MGPDNRVAPGPAGDAKGLEVLLERSLQGSSQALDVLITLLKTDHYQRILKTLRSIRSRAGTQTLEDVFQESVVELIEKVKSGELRDLRPEERRSVLRYFVWICDNKLRDSAKERKSPIFAREKLSLKETLVDEKAEIPGAARRTEDHRRLLHSAVTRLSPFEQQILTKYLAGVPYKEIARETGKSENALMLLVSDVKRRILEDIKPSSPTARLHNELDRGRDTRKPTADEIRKAVGLLPVECREAILHVHYEGGTLETLTKKLGDRGHDKAQARVKKGYETLAARLRAPFPESFQELNP